MPAGKKPQIRGTNSTSREVAIAAELDLDVPLPEGVQFADDEERVIWRQFARARVRDAWRDIDLLSLVKLTRCERDIRRLTATIDEQGETIVNQRGTPIVNPLCYRLDQQIRLQLAIMRSMGLMRIDDLDPRTLNQQGRAAATMRRDVEEFDDLIARGNGMQ